MCQGVLSGLKKIAMFSNINTTDVEIATKCLNDSVTISKWGMRVVKEDRNPDNNPDRNFQSILVVTSVRGMGSNSNKILPRYFIDKIQTTQVSGEQHYRARH